MYIYIFVYTYIHMYTLYVFTHIIFVYTHYIYTLFKMYITFTLNLQYIFLYIHMYVYIFIYIYIYIYICIVHIPYICTLECSGESILSCAAPGGKRAEWKNLWRAPGQQRQRSDSRFSSLIPGLAGKQRSLSYPIVNVMMWMCCFGNSLETRLRRCPAPGQSQVLANPS